MFRSRLVTKSRVVQDESRRLHETRLSQPDGIRILKTTRTPRLNNVIGDLKEGLSSRCKQAGILKQNTHRTEKEPSVGWEEVLVRYVIIVKVHHVYFIFSKKHQFTCGVRCVCVAAAAPSQREQQKKKQTRGAEHPYKPLTMPGTAKKEMSTEASPSKRNLDVSGSYHVQRRLGFFFGKAEDLL